MNNKNIKTYLYHAWTNASSEYVSNYNKGYYADHKNDWKVRKAKRQSERIQGGSEHDYWNQEILNAKTDRSFLEKVGKRAVQKIDLEKGGYALYDTVETGKKVINSVTDSIKKKRQEKGETSNSIFAIIKRGFSFLSDWFK